MANWKFVGSNSYNWLWTNGVDLAFCGNADASEIEDYPHPNAEIYYGGVENDYHGDVMAWLCDVNAIRETLPQMRQRCNVW